MAAYEQWKGMPTTSPSGKPYLYVTPGEPASNPGGYNYVNPQTGEVSGSIDRIEFSRKYLEVGGRKYQGGGVEIKYLEPTPDVSWSMSKREDMAQRWELKEADTGVKRLPSETPQAYGERVASIQQAEAPKVAWSSLKPTDVVTQTIGGKTWTGTKEFLEKKQSQFLDVYEPSVKQRAEQTFAHQAAVTGITHTFVEVPASSKKTIEEYKPVGGTEDTGIFKGTAILYSDAKRPISSSTMVNITKPKEKYVVREVPKETSSPYEFTKPTVSNIFRPEVIEATTKVKESISKNIITPTKDLFKGFTEIISPAILKAPNVPNITPMIGTAISKGKGVISNIGIPTSIDWKTGEITKRPVMDVTKDIYGIVAPKAKEIGTKVYKGVTEYKIRLPTSIDWKTGDIKEKKEIKEILPTFSSTLKETTTDLFRKGGLFYYDVASTQAKPIVPITKLAKVDISSSMPSREQVGKFTGKVGGIYADVVGGAYEGVRQEPEKVLLSFGVGLAFEGALAGGGAILSKTGASKLFFKQLSKIESPFLEKAIYKSPSYILGGAYVGAKGYDILTSGKPVGVGVGEALTTEIIPFAGAMKVGKSIFTSLTPREIKLKGTSRTPYREELATIKTTGKKSPFTTLTKDYGYVTKVKGDELTLNMKPMEYARFLEAQGKIDYSPFDKEMALRGKFGAVIKHGNKSKSILTKVKVSAATGIDYSSFDYDTVPLPSNLKNLKYFYKTPSMIEQETVHELIHYKTPRWILDIKAPSWSGYVGYRLEPSELLAWGLESKVKSFKTTANVGEYKDLVKRFRTLTILEKAPEGGIKFEYQREQITQKVKGGTAPSVSLQTGTIKELGKTSDIFGTKVGKSASGTIKTDAYNIYFKRSGEDIIAKYYTKGDVFLKEVRFPSMPNKPIRTKQTTQILKITDHELSKLFQLEGERGGALAEPTKQKLLGKEFRVVGTKQGMEGLFEVNRKVRGKTTAYLSQLDVAGLKKEFTTQLIGGKHKLVPPYITDVPTIKYAIKPKQLPTTVVQTEIGGEIIRKVTVEPPLVTIRRMIGGSAFEYVESKRARPLKAVTDYLFNPNFDKLQVSFGIPMPPQTITKPTTIVQALKPSIKTPTQRFNPILNLAEYEKISGLKPSVKAISIPLLTSKPTTIVRTEPTIKSVVTTRSLTRPETVTRTITKPEIMIRTITKPEVVTRTITKPETITRTITKPETITRTISRTMTQTISKTLSKTLTKTLTPTKTKITTRTFPKVPTEIIFPKIPLTFGLGKPRYKKPKRKKQRASYSPTLIGYEFMKPIKATRALSQRLYEPIGIRPVAIPNFKMPKFPRGMRV